MELTVGDWLDTVSKAFTRLEERVQALEVSGANARGELRDKLVKLECRIIELEGLAVPASPPQEAP